MAGTIELKDAEGRAARQELCEPSGLRGPLSRLPPTDPRPAQHRGGESSPLSRPWHTEAVFEGFTDQARRVLTLAQEEARELHHPFIGTEHLLLGLLREHDGIAAQVLGEMSVP